MGKRLIQECLINAKRLITSGRKQWRCRALPPCRVPYRAVPEIRLCCRCPCISLLKAYHPSWSPLFAFNDHFLFVSVTIKDELNRTPRLPASCVDQLDVESVLLDRSVLFVGSQESHPPHPSVIPPDRKVKCLHLLGFEYCA